MLSAQGPRSRARSPFAAAFLSVLFPGLGHAYAGAWSRALGFAAAPFLAIALLAGVILRLDVFELAGLALQGWVLTSVFVINLIAMVYRGMAVVDAFRVAHLMNEVAASGDGRMGRARIPFHPVSLAGLAAVLLVMAGGHVVVARYDLLAMSLADCVFGDTVECESGGSPSPGPSASGSSKPGSSDSPSPTLDPGPSGPPVASIPPWDGTERLDILLIGTDQRPREGTFNTDTLIVVSIDPVTRQVAMFSLPRDTVDVPLPAGPVRAAYGAVYPKKINAFYTSVRNRADLFPGTDRTRGFNGLKAVLGELYGINIRYYVEVNFVGFQQSVDALGGVTINVQMPVVDDRFPGEDGRLRRVYIPTGVQHMTGAEALIYARSRHGSNDFDRAQRQQRVLLSLREQADIPTLLPRIPELVAALSTAVRTDVPRELLPDLLGLASSIDTKAIRSFVFTPSFYQTEFLSSPRGYIIVPKVARIRAAVRDAFVVDPVLEAQREAIAAEGASVWVLNGSRVNGQAGRIAAYLEYLGLTASAPAQRPEGAVPPTTTIVVYNGAEVLKPATVALLEAGFGVSATYVVDPAIRVDIVITTGKATPDLAPPAAP